MLWRCAVRIQGRIGLESLEIAGLDSGSKPKGSRCIILRWIPHQAKTSVGATHSFFFLQEQTKDIIIVIICGNRKTANFLFFWNGWQIQTVQVQKPLGLRWRAGRENARREAAAGRRRDEDEGRAAAQPAFAPTAGVFVRGCVCVRAHTPGARTSLVNTAVDERCSCCEQTQ